MKVGDLVRLYGPFGSLHIVTWVSSRGSVVKLLGFPDNQVFVPGDVEVVR
jgi:hypothetical protein